MMIVIIMVGSSKPRAVVLPRLRPVPGLGFPRKFLWSPGQSAECGVWRALLSPTEVGTPQGHGGLPLSSVASSAASGRYW